MVLSKIPEDSVSAGEGFPLVVVVESSRTTVISSDSGGYSQTVKRLLLVSLCLPFSWLSGHGWCWTKGGDAQSWPSCTVESMVDVIMGKSTCSQSQRQPLRCCP